MLSPEIQHTIIKTILGYNPNLESIWLYGSQAKETATITSDIDICVKMPSDMHIDRKNIKLDWELLNKTQKEVHVVFCTIKNEWMHTEIYNNQNEKL